MLLRGIRRSSQGSQNRRGRVASRRVAMSHAGLLRWVSCRGPASNVSARVPGHHMQVIKASSLSLAMCLTTILTTIWICPLQYV